MSEPTSEALIEATNMLCRYVADHIAEGWGIRFIMSSDECSMDLINPESVDVEHVDTEYGVSKVESLCAASHEGDT